MKITVQKKQTFEYYEKIQKEFSNVKVVTWKEGFNFSAINNFGVQSAKGEYLLFLNNDTEIIEKDVIQEMLGYCQREDVGAVGARLLYQDDTIQHAGVVVGFGRHCRTYVYRPSQGGKQLFSQSYVRPGLQRGYSGLSDDKTKPVRPGWRVYRGAGSGL